MISIKKAFLIPIILINTTILGGCVSNPLQHTPHFFKNQHRPVIDYRYPQLKSITMLNRTLHTISHQTHLNQKFNQPMTGQHYLLHLYRTVPMQPKAVQKTLDRQIKAQHLNARQLKNYHQALHTIRPDEHQIQKGQRLVWHRLRHTKLSNRQRHQLTQTFHQLVKTTPTKLAQWLHQLF